MTFRVSRWAPAGTPAFNTSYGNIAPRFGIRVCNFAQVERNHRISAPGLGSFMISPQGKWAI